LSLLDLFIHSTLLDCNVIEVDGFYGHGLDEYHDYDKTAGY